MQLKKLMIEVMVFFVLGCFLCACGKTKDQTRKITKDTNKKIIIGGDNYPPFNYTDENGNPAGIDVELAKEAFSRMGYKPVFVNIDWENKKNLMIRKEAFYRHAFIKSCQGQVFCSVMHS